MPTPCSVDLDVLRAAAGPHRLLTTRRLGELGVARSTIWRRCGPDGPWTLMIRGVVRLATGTPTPTQRLLAAQLYGGPDAVVSGVAATHAVGLRRGRAHGPVLVLVPHGRHVVSRDYVVVERTTRMPPAQTRDGVRLAPVTRAVLDAARRVDERDEVRALVAEAVQRGHTTAPRLVEELERGTTRGAALVRAVLAEVGDGVRSAAEGWAHEVVGASDLPAPLWNVDLHGRDGFLARPDAYWADVGLAWQIDSREWHLDAESWARTQRRRRALEEAGVVVVSSLPVWLREDRRGVGGTLHAARARAALLPPPAVRVVLRAGRG